jgi:hypothetical protein
MGRIQIRFGVGTLMAVLGGALVGGGIVVIRVGVALEELGWAERIFAPSGKPAVLQGSVVATIGLVVILLSAVRIPRKRRPR